MSKQEQIETTPDLEHVAALLFNGLLSNPSIVKNRTQLREAGLKALANTAFKAACVLEQRLHEETSKG